METIAGYVSQICDGLYSQLNAIPWFGSIFASIVQQICSIVLSFLGGTGE